MVLEVDVRFDGGDDSFTLSESDLFCPRAGLYD
jgi:hypothetical protein